MLEVNPVAHHLRQFFPIGFVFPNRFLAFFIELRYTIADDIIFVFEAKRFFHFDFNRQAVRIPSCFAMHLKSLHRLVSANYIFQSSTHHMMNPGAAVCRRRTFVKSELLFPFTRRDTLLENVVCFPRLQNF